MSDAVRHPLHPLLPEQLTRKYEAICKRLYLYGFLGLPILWLINIMYFRYSEIGQFVHSPNIERDLHKCQIACIVSSILFSLWLVVFQVFKGSLSGVEID